MKTFQKCLIVLGIFVFADNAGTIVHEVGHAVTVVATGGEVDHIEVSPFYGSQMVPRSAPEPLAVLWYFGDSRNYAGRMLTWDGPGRARASVFWRIDDKDGHLRPTGHSWDGAWSKGLNKLLVLTDEGVFSLTPAGKTEDVLTKESLLRCWAGNEDMTRLVVAGRHPGTENYFLMAADLKSGVQTVHECDSEPQGMVFLDDRTAMASLNDAIVKFSWDDADEWRVDAAEGPESDTRIVAVFEGKPVFLRQEQLDKRTVRCWIEWDGRSVELSNIMKVMPWRGYLFAVATDGSLHRIDSSFDVQQIAPAVPGGWSLGQGVCDAGIWVAARAGQIRISSGTDLTVTVKVPTSVP